MYVTVCMHNTCLSRLLVLKQDGMVLDTKYSTVLHCTGPTILTRSKLLSMWVLKFIHALHQGTTFGGKFLLANKNVSRVEWLSLVFRDIDCWKKKKPMY